MAEERSRLVTPEKLDESYRKYLTQLATEFAQAQISPIVARYALNPSRLRQAFVTYLDDSGYDPAIVDDVFEPYDANRISNIIFIDWIQSFVETSDEDLQIITPWSLEDNKEESLFSDILGPSRRALPVGVHIINSQQSYNYDLTEEFVLGILLVLKDNTNIYLDLVDDAGTSISNPIKLSDIEPEYLKPKDMSRYSANISRKKYYFDSVDFIQGIITACQWINRNPQEVITNIMEGDNTLGFDF